MGMGIRSAMGWEWESAWEREDWDPMNPMGFSWDSHGNGNKISHGMGM